MDNFPLIRIRVSFWLRAACLGCVIGVVGDRVAAAPSDDDLAALTEHVNRSQFKEAEMLAARLERECLRDLGPADDRTTAVRLNLAAARQGLGDYEAAERTYRSVLLEMKPNGTETQQATRGLVLNNLSSLYQTVGDYNRAEAASTECVNLRSRLLGGTAPDTLRAKTNLGAIKWYLGDYEEARPLLEEVVRERRAAGDAARLGQALNNLGGLLKDQGRLADAEPLLREGLKLRESADPDSLETSHSLQYLGELLNASRKFDAAAAPLQRSLAIRRGKLGNGHTKIAESLTALGRCLQGKKNYSAAAAALREAISILEQAFGPKHPDLIKPVEWLAQIESWTGQPTAGQTLRRAAEIGRQALADVLAFSTERERFAFLRRSRPWDLAATLGDAAVAAETVLLWKGIVLDSVFEDRNAAASSPEARQALDAVDAARSRLRLLRSGRKDAAALREAESALEAAERNLARVAAAAGKARKSLGVTVASLQQAMTGGQVLLDFFRYAKTDASLAEVDRYGVIVLKKNGPAAFRDLGAAVEIDRKIAELREIVDRHPPGADEKARSLGRSLFDALLSPALPAPLPEQVLLCPDGHLCFLPFSGLLDEKDRFLGEAAALRFVSCSRDLLREAGAAPAKRVLLLGNPDYDLRGLRPGKSAKDDVRFLFASMRLSKLPGTQEEVNRISATATAAGWQKMILTNDAATEAGLRRQDFTGVLHLATHGICESEARRDVPPLFRTWLALAGANETLKSLQAGAAPDAEQDGLLLAAEACELDLHATWLVTLSACETALGELATGEGVLGLRRAFAAAGARNLVITLWPISDAETVEFMAAFYAAMAKGTEPVAALAATQRQQLMHHRTKNGLANAIKFAGAFVLTGVGR